MEREGDAATTALTFDMRVALQDAHATGLVQWLQRAYNRALGSVALIWRFDVRMDA